MRSTPNPPQRPSVLCRLTNSILYTPPRTKSQQARKISSRPADTSFQVSLLAPQPNQGPRARPRGPMTFRRPHATGSSERSISTVLDAGLRKGAKVVRTFLLRTQMEPKALPCSSLVSPRKSFSPACYNCKNRSEAGAAPEGVQPCHPNVNRGVRPAFHPTFCI